MWKGHYIKYQSIHNYYENEYIKQPHRWGYPKERAREFQMEFVPTIILMGLSNSGNGIDITVFLLSLSSNICIKRLFSETFR